MDVVETANLWGTFEQVREHLFNQFQEIPFSREGGLSLEELKCEVEGYLAAHLDQPRVLQKANIYRLVVTQGQICVDPYDWFVDKLNHGDLLRGLQGSWFKEAKAEAFVAGVSISPPYRHTIKSSLSLARYMVRNWALDLQRAHTKEKSGGCVAVLG
jgi:hypothetical protein